MSNNSQNQFRLLMSSMRKHPFATIVICFFIVFFMLPNLFISHESKPKEDVVSNIKDNNGFITESHVKMKPLTPEQIEANKERARLAQEAEEKKKQLEEQQAIAKKEEEAKQYKQNVELHAKDIINQANEFATTQKTKLKNYYATKEDLHSCIMYEVALQEIVKINITDSHEALMTKNSLSTLSRQLYASAMENLFRDNGFNMSLKAYGKDNKLLKISYPLMNEQTVYNIINKLDLKDTAKDAEFNKIYFTDGYDFNSSYEVDK
jgi:flagellar motor protein MotB